MTGKDALEILLQKTLKTIYETLPDKAWGLPTWVIVEASGLPWPVVRGLLAQLKVEGFLETNTMFSEDDLRILGTGWFLTPKARAFLATWDWE